MVKRWKCVSNETMQRIRSDMKYICDPHCCRVSETARHDSLQTIQRTIKRVSGLSHEIDLFTVSNEMVVAKKRELELSINLVWMLKPKLRCSCGSSSAVKLQNLDGNTFLNVLASYSLSYYRRCEVT